MNRIFQFIIPFLLFSSLTLVSCKNSQNLDLQKWNKATFNFIQSSCANYDSIINRELETLLISEEDSSFQTILEYIQFRFEYRKLIEKVMKDSFNLSGRKIFRIDEFYYRNKVNYHFHCDSQEKFKIFYNPNIKDKIKISPLTKLQFEYVPVLKIQCLNEIVSNNVNAIVVFTMIDEKNNTYKTEFVSLR
jgi:hypothetical protein